METIKGAHKRERGGRGQTQSLQEWALSSKRIAPKHQTISCELRPGETADSTVPRMQSSLWTMATSVHRAPSTSKLQTLHDQRPTTGDHKADKCLKYRQPSDFPKEWVTENLRIKKATVIMYIQKLKKLWQPSTSLIFLFQFLPFSAQHAGQHH